MVVQQIGTTLYFYQSSAATITNPLSKQILSSTISITPFLVVGNSSDPSQFECTYAAGNGYLFVFNPVCEPFYVSYDGSSTMTAAQITVQIRDFIGIPEIGVPFNFRPPTLTSEHQYNLKNQGWGNAWSTISRTSNTVGTGSFSFTVDSSTLPIIVGDTVVADSGDSSARIVGDVTDYTGFLLTITETSNVGSGVHTLWNISPFPNYINTFFEKAKSGGGDGGTAKLIKKYPSNAEQWWQYRSTNVTRAAPDGTFSPSVTTDYVVLNNNQTAQGSIILNAFNQTRSVASGVSGLTDVITLARPTNGCWFQGRVWFTGINASQQATGDAQFYTWTENLYFSQIITRPEQFGRCYQQDDPTSPDFFDLLPDDGGVIVLQGVGQIFKLVPVQNGLMVFAANGIWFITGSQGIGFAPNDYTITQISGIRSNSSTSFLDVLGWPVFWNEEGIYSVTPSKQGGGIEVTNLVIGTIASYYSSIPLVSKKFARGAYNPLDYTMQWLFRSASETSITDRYQYDFILVYNTANKAFYIHTIGGSTRVHDCIYVSSPGSSNSPDPIIKYIVSFGTNMTFAEERDFTNYVDFNSGIPVNFVSTFTTGYMLHGKAAMKFQVPYVFMFLNANNGSYKINGLWNYSATGNSGKWTNTQIFTLNDNNYDKMYNRVRIRGRGNALQIKITSEDGQPFDFSGWCLYENINAGI